MLSLQGTMCTLPTPSRILRGCCWILCHWWPCWSWKGTRRWDESHFMKWLSDPCLFRDYNHQWKSRNTCYRMKNRKAEQLVSNGTRRWLWELKSWMWRCPKKIHRMNLHMSGCVVWESVLGWMSTKEQWIRIPFPTMMTKSAWSFRSHFVVNKMNVQGPEMWFWKTFLVAHVFWGISILFFSPMIVLRSSHAHRCKNRKSAHLIQVHVPQRRYTYLYEARQQQQWLEWHGGNDVSFRGSWRFERGVPWKIDVSFFLRWGPSIFLRTLQSMKEKYECESISEGLRWKFTIYFWIQESVSHVVGFSQSHVLIYSLSRNVRHVCWLGVSVHLSWFRTRWEGYLWSLWWSVTGRDFCTVGLCNSDYRRNPDGN